MSVYIDTPENPAGYDPQISRRTFLKRAGLAAAAGAAIAGSGIAATRARALEDGDTLSGTIAAGTTASFNPNSDVTVTVAGDLTVEGTLQMRPANSGVTHILRFTGGGELYVTAGGKLDIQGTPKTAWNRTGDDSTWSGSDDLVVTPVASGDYTPKSFTKGGSVPSVSTPQGTFQAEVLNLTRNARIEGTSGTFMKRIMFENSTVPQTIKYLEVRYIGDADTMGMYPLHFHKNGNATRGSLIEGVVVQDSDHHAFVPHASHGMTFRNCIAYKIVGDAYWWDPPPDDKGPENNTDDTLYDACVAVDLVRGASTGQGELSGFYMGGGTGNAAIGCVAAVSEQFASNSGFHWGSKNNEQPNTWVFEDCVSHNHRDWGVFVWQNTGTLGHLMNRYVGYHNGRGGVKHGAYNNQGYHYLDNVYHGNGEPVALHAQVAAGNFTPASRIIFQSCHFAGDPGLRIADHVLPASHPSIFVENTFDGGVLVKESTASGVPDRGYVDFVRNTRNGSDLEASDFDVEVMHAESVIRVQRRDGSAFQISGPNGTVSTISTFFDESLIKPIPPAPGTTDWVAACGNETAGVALSQDSFFNSVDHGAHH